MKLVSIIFTFFFVVCYALSTAGAAKAGLRTKSEPTPGSKPGQSGLLDQTNRIKQILAGLQTRSDLADLQRRSPYHQVIVKKVESLINGKDYDECGPTELGHYIDKLFAGLSDDELSLFHVIYTVGYAPFYSVFVNGATSANSIFYPNKQQGMEYKKRTTDLQRFWDTYPSPLAVYSASGHFFADTELMVKTLQEAYKFDDKESATEMVEFVQQVFEKYPAIGYDFPIWTLNAMPFAWHPAGNGIVFGDGMKMFLEFAGLGNAGPDYVLFHEFGHLVQFGNDVPRDGTPENTRQTELMADALAAYYAHSPRGASFQTKRIQEIVKVAYDVGDCYFTDPVHHGTPNQRAKAVEFATKLIDTSIAKGQILPSATFIALFDSALPGIVASDAAEP